MPIYEYLCCNCKRKFELMRPMSRSSEMALCPNCGGGSQRVLSAFAARAKGAEGESSLGGSSCSTCASKTCSSCSP